MEAGLQDDQVVPLDEVDEAMLVGEAARPSAGEGVFKLLGIADAAEGVAAGVVDEPVDVLDHRPVRG